MNPDRMAECAETLPYCASPKEIIIEIAVKERLMLLLELAIPRKFHVDAWGEGE